MKYGCILVGCAWVFWYQSIVTSCEGDRCFSNAMTQHWEYKDTFDTRERCEAAVAAGKLETAEKQTKAVQAGRDLKFMDHYRCFPIGLHPRDTE